MIRVLRLKQSYQHNRPVKRSDLFHRWKKRNWRLMGALIASLLALII